MRAIAADSKLAPALLVEAARAFALARADGHAATALDLLKRAATAGWFRDPLRLSTLQSDADFADVRALPEFATWAQSLQPRQP